ncbi:MAG: hypothetical protein KKB31_02815 [Nanoarchaeota archaeon]|nr:hypothetical protein [Nanoarchaeota archaeon]
MVTDDKPTNYLKALKSKPLKEIKMYVPERKKALLDQDKKCFKCKKSIRPYLYKYIRDPLTKEMHVFCADCVIPMPKKRI